MRVMSWRRELSAYANRKDVIVLALPRGGVPVAFEVARALNAPLDVFLVRKLGAPGQAELAMGAIASGGVVVQNEDVVKALKISREAIATAVEHEQKELARREAMYRGGRPPLDVEDKTVILIDDGLATGSTMRAAVAALRNMHPAQSWSPFRLVRPRRATSCGQSPTTASVPSPRSTSAQSGSGTMILPRPTTPKSATC